MQETIAAMNRRIRRKLLYTVGPSYSGKWQTIYINLYYCSSYEERKKTVLNHSRSRRLGTCYYCHPVNFSSECLYLQPLQPIQTGEYIG